MEFVKKIKNYYSQNKFSGNKYTSRVSVLSKNKQNKVEECVGLGLKNYLTYQQFPQFNWPYWITNSENIKSKYFNQKSFPILLNTTLRDNIAFNNFISKDEIYISPNGMISFSYLDSSVELWIKIGDEIYKPDIFNGDYKVKRDPFSGIVKSEWNCTPFKIYQEIYALRSSIDEAVIDIKLEPRSRVKDFFIILAIRPYNQEKLGTINKIQCSKDNNVISVNGKTIIALNEKPDGYFYGNGEIGDLDVNIMEDSFMQVKCSNEMASCGFVFKVKKGMNFSYRISLDAVGEIKTEKFNYKQLKEDFDSYSRMRIQKGFNISLPSKKLTDIFYLTKLNLLSHLKSDIFSENNNSKVNGKTLFYIVYAKNRMGFSSEAKKIIGSAIEISKYDEKNFSFHDIISGAFLISSFTDYYLLTRDMDFLTDNYKELTVIGKSILEYLKKFKTIEDFKENSIEKYLVKEGHYFDLIIVIFSLQNLSYLARCMGIFGDEKKFDKRVDELFKIYNNYLESFYSNNENIQNEFFFYDIFSNYPFKLKKIESESVSKIKDKIFNYFKEMPVNIKSMGYDILSTLIIVNNLLLEKEPVALSTFNDILNVGVIKGSFPEYINPHTGLGNFGNGSSVANNVFVFSFLRNMMFVDYENRLDIFPIPDEKWFTPGKEIVVENAPSRFGLINMRVISTENEIQFHFESLPKYIPPDIMINLPFKVKLLEGEDFIIKKVINNSYVINGWPTIVRFLRK